jgi:hypothetical protein
MKRTIIYVVSAVVVIGGLAAVVPRLRQRARQVAANLKMIGADTGDVMASATYQRFAARRQAVATMKATLKSVAAAESALVADSGRPTAWLMTDRRYGFVNDKSNFGPFIYLQRDRLVAKIGSHNTTMGCMLTAMLDTTTGRYHAGEPVCGEWSPLEGPAKAPVPSHPARH